MNTQLNLPGINLRLFDGGAAGGSTAAPAPATGGDMGGSAESPNNNPVSGKQGKSGKTADNVVYGKQASSESVPTSGKQNPAAAGTGDVAPTAEEFEEMISGKYKDLFAQRTQKIINDRFKETKNLEKQLGEVSPVLDTLMSKYDIKDGDIGKLSAAIDSDNAYWEELAEREGMTVEQVKQVKRMESENRQLNAILQKQKQQQAADSTVRAWQQEAESMKATVPEFDLQRELQNDTFADLLTRQIPMETVYQIVHLDDIKAGAAKQAEKKVTDNIRANGNRPAENGASAPQSAFTIKDDPRKFTREDRREIARRVARGENIQL